MQSYVGPAPRPAENFFSPVGQVNPNYSRGDVQITQPGLELSTQSPRGTERPRHRRQQWHLVGHGPDHPSRPRAR